jgi:hypothetical protein
MTSYERLILIAEARVARQKDLIATLEEKRLDAAEAKSMLAGLDYNLRVLKEKKRRAEEPLRPLLRRIAKRQHA